MVNVECGKVKNAQVNVDTFSEAKKGRTGGHSKSVVRMAPDESVFVQFLREAGVMLKQDKASNEIGKLHVT